MKVFISQPMRGKSDEEIVEERDWAYQHILNKHGKDSTMIIESYDPAMQFTSPVEALSKSLAMLADADVAYFMDGWQVARGCYIERNVCEAYGIPVADLPPVPWKRD